MTGDLNDRSRHILQVIIEEYIATAEPVGSRTITRRDGVNLSPASVRNVMSDLEEMGFLSSPHTSAGRIPTDRAYRFYVNTLLQLGKVSNAQEEQLLERLPLQGGDASRILRETSRMLSSLSHCAGIVLAPRFTENVLRHLEFVKLGGRRLLAILVTEHGIVHNKLVELQEDISGEDLVRMTNYLNTLLQGLPMTEVRRRLIEQMQNDKVKYDSLLDRALRLSKQALADTEADLFIVGQSTFFNQPEFADTSRMKELFRAFEEKGQLLELLDRCLAADGVQIFIGNETNLNPAGMSVITSAYRSGSRKLGVLGVIGPTRMGYASVIPIVDYTARLVSRLLQSDEQRLPAVT
jgi:heat-inducible transcriptional repressor